MSETVVRAVADVLAAAGVRDVFGLVGSGNLVLANALVKSGAAFHHVRHESAAVSAADGYARASDRLGVATVHQGPGLTNTATALTEAAKSRTPLVLLAADSPAAQPHSNFRIDAEGLIRATGAIPERVHGPASAIDDAVRAVRTAQVQRMPVALLLATDVQQQQVTGTTPSATAPPPAASAPAPAAIEAAADLLAASQRPVVLAGRGAVLSDARQPLRTLGDQLGAVLATSAVAKGLFAGDSYDVGISGGFAVPLAAELLRQADAVVAAGASLNMWTTRHGELLGGAAVVQVDVDVEAIGRHRPADVGIVADAALTARALTAELAQRGAPRQGFRTAGLAGRIAAGTWRDQPYDDVSTVHRVDPRTLSLTLDELLPRDRVVATDSGHFMGFPAMYLSVPEPRAFVFTQAYQSVGLGLSSALGAAVAQPHRLTVAALGDGGALMGLPEFETAARLGPPLLVVVYNDAAYGAEVHHFGPMGEPVDLVRFPDTDFAALGRAAGGAGCTVRTRADLSQLMPWLDDPRGLYVVDAKVTADFAASWLEEAFRPH